MNDIQIFQYQDQPVRTVQRDGEPWFVLKDVCAVLGLGTPASATRVSTGNECTILIEDGEALGASASAKAEEVPAKKEWKAGAF